MIEVFGDLWDSPPGWLCLTTNGVVSKHDRAVMGAGCALEAKNRIKDIDLHLGKRIKSAGNMPHALCRYHHWLVLSFPVKHHWRDKADLQLIEMSAHLLRGYWLKFGHGCIVTIPRPGCGNGGLEWELVKESLVRVLIEDDFRVIHFSPV